MGSSQSRDSLIEETVTPGSDSSSVTDIPIVVLEHEPQVQPPVEEPSVQEPSVEEPSVEEPPVVPPSAEELPQQSEKPTSIPDVAVAESIVEKSPVNDETPAVIKPNVTVADPPVMTQGGFAEMMRDAIIKHNLPRNVKIGFTMTPVTFTINRKSQNKPVSDVIEMSEANPVVVQPASESQPASETEKVPEVIETRSEDS